jgi:subtilisin family serine protease
LRRGALLLAAAAASSLLLAPAGQAGPRDRVEVVVTLRPLALAQAVAKSRVWSARTKAQRLDLRSAGSVWYLRQLARIQRATERRIVRAIPQAHVRWRYRVVLDGLALVLPRNRLQTLARVPGVVRVWPGAHVRPALDRSPQLIGADQLWGLPSFSTAGNGVKIAIIDDGIDQKHPFFDPTGFSYPAGFPKGNTAYTTPKVIVARAFAPPNTTWKYARVPFDPVYSDHGTHVAGIAGGDYTPVAAVGRGPLSGVAPKAYLGNYKMNSTPFGNELIENSAELAAAIEAAVRDGMDVINISYGEIEVGAPHDIVDRAVDGAAAAGVVPVVAAGNDFEEFGRGSISSPGTAGRGISVAAVSKTDIVASFSSSGPTPLSDRLKPDVSAPGVSILSSVPSREGTWVQFSGTSMATPHVAGGAALLLQRHPSWSVAELKSALVLTAGPAYADAARTEAPTTREGAGLINLPRANAPLIFAAPSSLSFGLLRVGKSASRTIALTDAGGGAGAWGATVQLQGQAQGVTVSVPSSVSVPGRLDVRAAAAAGAAEADITGFAVLTHGTTTRRIPFWFRVERPRLGRPSATLTRQGNYTGTTRGKPARVTSYRYPDDPSTVGVATSLPGPEQVFRIRIRRAVANFGVVLLGAGRGVRVTPRLVAADDENRLLGYRGLPTNNNPYLETFGRPQPIVAAVYPARGTYDVVFDTPSSNRAGPFTFRFWLNDTKPPSARLTTPRAKRGTRLLVALSDTGSGVDPATLSATIDGHSAAVFYAGKARRAVVSLRANLSPGRHRLSLRVSDYQEEKNSESVPGVLPNTRFYGVGFTVTP